MRRYVTATRQPRSDEDDWWYDPTAGATITVHEPDTRAHPIGLIDKHGNPIMAVIEPDPIGYVRHD